MSSQTVTIRPARHVDIDSINRVIEAAVMTWDIPERVKRLSLSSYRYTDIDFNHLDMVVAEDAQQNIVGIAAWEPASAKDLPKDKTALLLHGIYVDPAMQRHGVGQQLFRAAEKAAQKQVYDGLLVKAQRDANAFFIAMGMQQLEVEDPEKHYTNRYWKNLIKS
jgi:predicted N-acetyltransferase YhbS